MHVMHLWQVKTPAESKYPYDYCKEVGDAFRRMKRGARSPMAAARW